MGDEGGREEPRKLGRYLLVSKLAEGGMAEVWVAREDGLAGLRRLVVIKLILARHSQDPEFLTMFLDEARTVAQLNHPNIVQIYELGLDDENYFIAMELIVGESVATLSTISGARRALPISIAVRIIADACKGLHHAHVRATPDGRPLGIVHRDISPQNIMVSYEGDVKVVDFGIAKAANRLAKTQVGILKGKHRYMSPEQVLGEQLDARADIFALGVVLFELLTGVRLFDSDSIPHTLYLVSECKIPPPSSLNPAVPKELEQIVLKALARDRDHRYQDAATMKVALEGLSRAGLCGTNEDVTLFMRSVCRDQREKKLRMFEEVYRVDPPQVTAKTEPDTKLPVPGPAPASPGSASNPPRAGSSLHPDGAPGPGVGLSDTSETRPTVRVRGSSPGELEMHSAPTPVGSLSPPADEPPPFALEYSERLTETADRPRGSSGKNPVVRRLFGASPSPRVGGRSRRDRVHSSQGALAPTATAPSPKRVLVEAPANLSSASERRTPPPTPRTVRSTWTSGWGFLLLLAAATALGTGLAVALSFLLRR